MRQYEAQSSDTLQDTIKAAILAHNPQDPEWRRHVGLNATRLQGYETLKSEWKAMHQAYRQWGIADGNDTTPMEVDALMKGKGKNKSKGKGKEKGKDKGKEKEQGDGEGMNIRHVEYGVFLLCELIMIDSGASVHVCPPDHGQEYGLRKTRPLLTASRAEMKQHGMRQVSHDTEVGSAGRAMATRHGVGRVRHLDARLSWLQQLCAEGVVQVRARPGEHNEADLGTKMVDLRRQWVGAHGWWRRLSPLLQRQQNIAVY